MRAWGRRLILTISATAAVSSAHAWGPDGHHMVGSLAGRLIAGSHAGLQAQATLGSLSLADAGVWADCVKGVDPITFRYESARHPECVIFETADGEAAMVDFVRRNSTNCAIRPGEEVCHKQYHYSDIPIQRDGYQPAFFGARNDDIVAAIAAMVHVLRGHPAPVPFNIKNGREALLLLAHYVGDIHQPLHVGVVYLDMQGRLVNPDEGTFDPATSTRGGNSIMVLPDVGKNLHATWDWIPKSMMMEQVNGAWIVAARAVPLTSGPVSSWPGQWASDSVREANLVLSALTFGPLHNGQWTVDLPADYRVEMTVIKKKQLIRAGAHLAQLLQDIWP